MARHSRQTFIRNKMIIFLLASVCLFFFIVLSGIKMLAVVLEYSERQEMNSPELLKSIATELLNIFVYILAIMGAGNMMSVLQQYAEMMTPK